MCVRVCVCVCVRVCMCVCVCACVRVSFKGPNLLTGYAMDEQITDYLFVDVLSILDMFTYQCVSFIQS